MMIELDKSLTIPVYTPESARWAGLTEVEIRRVFSREALVNPFLQSEVRNKCLTALNELLCILAKLGNRK